MLTGGVMVLGMTFLAWQAWFNRLALTRDFVAAAVLALSSATAIVVLLFAVQFAADVQVRLAPLSARHGAARHGNAVRGRKKRRKQRNMYSHAFVFACMRACTY